MLAWGVPLRGTPQAASTLCFLCFYEIVFPWTILT